MGLGGYERKLFGGRGWSKKKKKKKKIRCGRAKKKKFGREWVRWQQRSFVSASTAPIMATTISRKDQKSLQAFVSSTNTDKPTVIVIQEWYAGAKS